MTNNSHAPGLVRRSTRRVARASTLAAITTIGLLMTVVEPAAAASATVAQGKISQAPIPQAALQPQALPAAAVGRLGVTGCAEGAGVASCDLYAMTGSTTFLGQTLPIWGFSTTGAPGSATAPGPVLVVNLGDTVTVRLHNGLAENVSLAFPGQPAGAFTAGLPTANAQDPGVATGATATYTFTASRAGTFTYEAGHTADGTRQVAMGLAGALVVLPNDGSNSAYGTPQAGYPDTGYDDDAVLVLSEIDPALNADPAQFDMRSFSPKYRLINGKPFPETNPIATDQGHKVLLRYVNVGSQMHSMGVLGADQVQIAQDGHPMKFASTAVVEPVEPGATVDAIVTMPTGPESKLAVYEPAEHLDNNGQNNGNPLQLAFGGMLTFLDTSAPPPTSDAVGPVSSNIVLSPSTTAATSPVTVSADLSDVTTGGSNVVQAEFVVDDAVTTGPGFGTPMTGAFGAVTVTGATGSIPTAALSALDAGKHTVYVRALDSAGNWGVIGSAILNVAKSGPQTTNGSATISPANGEMDVEVSATGDDSAVGGTITAAEYFIDTVGANGSGTAMTRNRTASVVSVDATIAAATVKALGEGHHTVYVHTKDSLGIWGAPLAIDLVVDLTGPTVDAASVGPNPTNGVLSDKGNPGYLLVSAQITDRDAGNALQSTLMDAEGFLDPSAPNPAGGTGFQLVAVDGLMDSTTEAVYGLIPISQVKSLGDGLHHVYVRGEDAAGNWGPLFAVSLTVDKTAPVLGMLVATPNPTGGAATVTLSAPVTDASLISTAEYWTGAVDPGVGHGSALPVNVANGVLSVSVDVSALLNGTYQFNLRAQDLAGNWSKPVSTSVQVMRPNRIFGDNFESGNLSAWSSTTGPVVSVTASAALPTSLEPASTRGLQVALPSSGVNKKASYVTDNSPAGETGYHAVFAFNPGTLTAGTSSSYALTIFEARNAANTRIFSLQYRVSGGSRQLRTVMARSTGGTLTGAWVTVGTGTQTVQLDWSAATAGSLKLSVNGVVRQTDSGNTNTLRIDSALLGVISGIVSSSTSGSKGTAYFDSFLSNRYTMP